MKCSLLADAFKPAGRYRKPHRTKQNDTTHLR